MRHTLFIIFLLVCSSRLSAQDTLWVEIDHRNVYLQHRVQDGENVMMLAKRFHSPAAKLADVNGINYQTGLAEGSFLKIPIGKFNYLRINSEVHSRPIYLRLKPGDDLQSVSRALRVSRGMLQRWNKLETPNPDSLHSLQVGWVKYNATAVPFYSAKEKRRIADSIARQEEKQQLREDSIRQRVADSLAAEKEESEIGFGKEFHERNANRSLTLETGAAVFYSLKARVKRGAYYAFHNTAPRGAIISVLNPANGKVVYAKVVGPIPKISMYHNAIIGLSNNAARALGAKDQRMFCKIKY